MTLTRVSALAAIFLLGAIPARAAEYEIRTLNMSSHGMFQFEPTMLRIQPGDSVHFIAKDKGHNVQSIANMIPDGAQPFKGEMNQDLTVKFDKPGVYGVECPPHYAMGMVALIVVGDASTNLAQAEAISHPGKAKQAFEKLFEQASQTAKPATPVQQ